jgi:hypothetical protein
VRPLDTKGPPSKDEESLAKPEYLYMVDGTVRRICPDCGTLCSTVLVFNSPSKKTNGLFWRCDKADCGFKENVTALRRSHKKGEGQ